MFYFYLLLQLQQIIAIPEFAYGDDSSMSAAYLGSLTPQAALFTKNIIIAFPRQFSQNPQILLSIVNAQASQGFRITPKEINTTQFLLEYQFYIGQFNGAGVKYFAVVDDNLQIDNIEMSDLFADPIFEGTNPLTKNFPQIPNAIIFLNAYDYSIESNLEIQLSITDVSLTEYSYRMESSSQLTYFAVVVIIGISPYLDTGSQFGTIGNYTLGQTSQYDYFIQQGINGVTLIGMNLLYSIQKQFDNVTCVMNVQLNTTLTSEPQFSFSYFFYRPCGLDYACNDQLLPRNFQECSLKKNGCPMSYYADLSINKCLQCSADCNTCATSSTNCLSCANALMSLPSCICEDHQYLDTNTQCQECPDWCSQCDGIQCIGCAANCSTCNYLTCLTCISTNYYIKEGLCLQCPDGCATCDQQQCLQCNYPLQLIDRKCTENCLFPCLSCILEQCLLCTIGYYPASTSCIQCETNCVACLNSQQCLSCDSTKYRTLNQYNQCECIQGYVEDNNICKILDGQKSQQVQSIDNCAQIVTFDNQLQCVNCIYGYLNINGSCQQCDMRCLACSLQINVCTTCRFITPRTDLQCELCESYPGYYSDYTTNQCNTICGDGIIAGNEKCDDLLQPIGCSNCQALSNYMCNQYECELIIYPIPSLVQLSDTTQIYNSTKILLLSYNIELAQFDTNITIKLSDSLINFNYQQIVINQSYYIYLTLMNTSISSNLTILFNNNNIQSLMGQIQQLKYINIQISDYILITETTKKVVSGISQGIDVILILVLVFLGISILFGGLEIYWNLLDLLQRISYLKYINTILPYNMTEIVNLLSYVQLNNLPFMEYLNLQFIPDDTIYVEPPLLIAHDGYTCSISQNILPILVPWLISICVFVFAKILQSPILYINVNQQIDLENKLLQVQRYLYNQVQIICNQWIWSGMVRLYQSSAYDICFILALGLYGITTLDFMDQYLTLGLIVIHMGIIYACFQVTSFKLSTIKQFDNKYGAVTEGLEIHHNKILFNNFTFVKKGMFMITLVLLYDQPLFQISSILLIQVSQILSLLNLDPLQNKIEQNKQILCESLMTLSQILINLLVLDDYYTLFTYDQRDIIGWIWISCISIIIATQLLIDLIQQITIFKKKEKPIDINKLKI